MIQLEQAKTTKALGTTLAEVLGPLDLREYGSNRVVVAENKTGGPALADFKVELAPTANGPWLAEDLTGNALLTLAAGAAGVYRFAKLDGFVRVRAKAAELGEGQSACELTVRIAVG